MTKIKFYSKYLAINLILFNLLSNLLPVQAIYTTNRTTTKISQILPKRRKNPGKNPGEGAPRGTRPGGSRGCLVTSKKPFIPLLPVYKNADGAQLAWSRTTQERPTFWYYVPFEAASIKSVKFSLRDEEDKVIYEAVIALNSTPGIISISLPKNLKPLEVDKWYKSYLFISTYCSNSRKLEKLEAYGAIKREAMTSELKELLDKEQSPLKRASIYAQNNIWNDALTILGEMHHEQSTINQWKQLLESEGLGDFVTEPIVE